MTFYFDENLPRHLAVGFDKLQYPEGLKIGKEIHVHYIPDKFGRGVKDFQWIPEIAKLGALVVTQDVNITRRKHELELYKHHKLGIFLLKGITKKKGLSVWEMVQTLAKNWEEICVLSDKYEPPFAFEFSLKGKIRKLSV
jgi:hypothetical protein